MAPGTAWRKVGSCSLADTLCYVSDSVIILQSDMSTNYSSELRADLLSRRLMQNSVRNKAGCASSALLPFDADVSAMFLPICSRGIEGVERY